MAKSNSNKNSQKNLKKNHKSGGGGGEKSFFRVNDGRAMKAKKNKAFIKFNKVCFKSWGLKLGFLTKNH